MKKGNTIQQFLQKGLEILRKDFSELRSAGVEQLMYIKEDLIIPHVGVKRGWFIIDIRQTCVDPVIVSHSAVLYPT
ncbi:hypothetical protein chiPu_0026003, partial [Chiloscyllium punctatum]|nr:hypothetical protein [Chiloscyllium punctatum]